MFFFSRPTPRPSPPLTPIGRCRVYGSHLQATNSQCQTHGVGKITKRREVGSSALPPPVGRTPAGEGQIALFRTTAWKVYVPSHRPSPICKALPGNCTTTTRPYGPGLTLPALEPQFVSAPPGPRGGPLGRGWGGAGGLGLTELSNQRAPIFRVRRPRPRGLWAAANKTT